MLICATLQSVAVLAAAASERGLLDDDPKVVIIDTLTEERDALKKQKRELEASLAAAVRAAPAGKSASRVS